MMLRCMVAIVLPAAAVAFGPSMPLASAPGLARSAGCRTAATPALRMAVTEVGSEAELDDAIAGAGVF